MRIAVLQFAPQLGDVELNMTRAEGVLDRENPRDLDLIVLPEMAFTGYNFKSLVHIYPYLEPTESGITSLWARTIALKHNCVVTVGYPEKVDITGKWPASPEYYNSAVTVNADGETIANYRKTFLFFRDETWALEGPDGFFDGEISGLGNVVMGICKWPTRNMERMDLNPYKFQAPLHAWEFAYHILHKQANLVILSMAWMTDESYETYSRNSTEPDMEALSYWISRLEPVIRNEERGEIIVVLANRCGVEGDAIYTGTSCVIGIYNGEVKLYGVLSRGEKRLLVVDTSEPPEAKLVQEDRTPANADTRDTRDKEPMSSIDARIAETIPLSPVEPFRQHAFFSAELALLSRDSPEPNSASSLYVNTPWDRTPSSFRAEDLTRIVNSTSPQPSTLQNPSSSNTLQVPSPAPSVPAPSHASTRQLPSPSSLHAPLPSTNLHVPSTSSAPQVPSPPPNMPFSTSSPAMQTGNIPDEPPTRPEAPKVRNSSRTRPTDKNPPAIATKDLAESALSVASPFQNLTLSEGNRALRDRVAMSATTSTGYSFAVGEEGITPQQRMAQSATTPHGRFFPMGGSSSSPHPQMASSAGNSPGGYDRAAGNSNPPRPRTTVNTSLTTIPSKHKLMDRPATSTQARAPSNTSKGPPILNVATGESSRPQNAQTAMSNTTSAVQNSALDEAGISSRARTAANVSTSPTQNLPPGEASSSSPRANYGDKRQI